MALYLRWVPNPNYAGAIDFKWRPDSDGRMSIRLRPTGETPLLEPQPDDDFERYEQDGAFNPARFRILSGNEVQVEGMIANSAEYASSDPIPVWVFPPPTVLHPNATSMSPAMPASRA